VLCKHEVVGSIPSGSTKELRSIADAAATSKTSFARVSDAGQKPARTLLRVPRHREEETYPDDPGSDGDEHSCSDLTDLE
jgi:hypothetical protein